MAFGLSKTRVSPIAIDFGADSIKLLQVVPTDPPQLIAAGAAEVPGHARTDPAQRQAFYIDSLRSLLKLQPFKGRAAVCSIPAYQLLVQHLQIPPTDASDLEQQISVQLRQRLNLDASRMVVRHFQVGSINRDGSAKEELICLAASREAVMRHIDTARRVKLDVVGMHAEPVAILRTFSHLYRESDAAERTTCFIDLGAATTKVIIAHGAQMVFAKTIHAGGDHVTRRLAEARQIDFAQARDLRVRGAAGRGADAAGSGGASISESATQTAALGESGGTAVLVEPKTTVAAQAHEGVSGGSAGGDSECLAIHGDTLDCLIDELQLCVRYHQSMFPGRAIEKLVFLGGEANHVGPCQQIARALRIGAQLGDPLARLTRMGHAATGLDLSRPQPGWAVPLGLCLSEANL